MSLESDYTEFVSDVNEALAGIEKKLNTPVLDLSNEFSKVRAAIANFGHTVTAAPVPAPVPTEPVVVTVAPASPPVAPDKGGSPNVDPNGTDPNTGVVDTSSTADTPLVQL